MWVTMSHQSKKWETDSGYSVECGCDHMDAFCVLSLEEKKAS